MLRERVWRCVQGECGGVFRGCGGVLRESGGVLSECGGVLRESVEVC